VVASAFLHPAGLKFAPIAPDSLLMEARDLRSAALGDQRGFTLIELLVVILIIGILAGAALAAFIGQTHKAYDASAKQLASSAQIAAETYGIDNKGSYKELSPSVIHEYEVTIPTSAEHMSAGAWLLVAAPIEEGAGYEVATVAPEVEYERFTIVRHGDGSTEKKCAPVIAARGCASGTW